MIKNINKIKNRKNSTEELTYHLIPQWFFARHRFVAVHQTKLSPNNEKKAQNPQVPNCRSRSSPFAIKTKHQTPTKLATFSERSRTPPDRVKLGDPNPSHKEMLKTLKENINTWEIGGCRRISASFAGEKSCFPADGGGFPTKLRERKVNEKWREKKKGKEREGSEKAEKNHKRIIYTFYTQIIML